MAEVREKRFKREFAALVNERKRSALTVLRTLKHARLPETEITTQGPDFCHFRVPVISEVLNQVAEGLMRRVLMILSPFYSNLSLNGGTTSNGT